MLEFIIWYFSGLVLGNFFTWVAWYYFKKVDIMETNKWKSDDKKIKEINFEITPFVLCIGLIVPLLGPIYVFFAFIAMIALMCVYVKRSDKVLKNFKIKL